MSITKKIWIIEADNDECWSEPIIKDRWEEAEDYVCNEFEAVVAENPDFNYYWEIENGTGTASVSNDHGEYYNWRITEHEIEIDVVINTKTQSKEE